jgi:TonB-linked SusC/RagA family outer membrane protein
MKKTILFIVLATLCPFLKLSAQNNPHPPTSNIIGKVTDEQGQPLPGATIKLKGTNIFVVTDESGAFKMSPVPTTGLLVISFVSYQTTEINYNTANRNSLIIILKPDHNSLNEVQIVGYGTTTKRLNTGSVTSISSEIISNQPVSNPLSSLQGRASGVSIQTQNGLPGGNISVQIRGQGSLASGTDPLYIVDGVPFLSSPVLPYSQLSANGPISPFGVLNPGDIASIDILKDADATAIYGSRGANGVVLITTKKGSSGKTNFTIQASQGYSQISRYAPYMNLPQYLQMRTEAYKNDGITPTASDAPDLLVWSQTKSTDWQKYEFGNKAHMTTLQTSLSGGSPTTNFLFSMNYRNEGSILPGDVNYKKGGGYLNIDQVSDDKRFKATLTVNYTLDDNHTLYNASTTIAGLSPNYPIYDSDGSYNFEANYNPVAQLNQKSRIQSDNLIANVLLQYNLCKDLSFKISSGYTKYNLTQLATLPSEAQSNLYFTPDATMYLTNNSSSSWIIEPQVNYSISSKFGALTALIGSTLQERLQQGSVLTGIGVNNPALLGNIGSASNVYGSNDYSDYKYVSFFGRINYNWQRKYVLNLNFRRDGSSRFGNNRQFGDFGAVGGAWLFAQEDLIRDNLTFLSFGKLRASYGVTGNDQIPDYQYLTAYNSGAVYNGITSLAPSRIANPNYSWETTKQLEAAIELGFLKNQIMLTVARYRRKSDNQLVTYPLPYQSGFSGYQANLPAVVQNSGWEFDLNTINIEKDNFSWKSSINFTVPTNKLVAYPGLASSSYANTFVVGQDLSIVKGYQFLGVDPKTGNAQLKDVNNDGFVKFPEDVVVLGKTSPVFYGGFNNTLSYKGFQFDLFFEFRKQNSQEFKPGYGSLIENEPTYILGRWKQPGDQTTIPKYSTITVNQLNASNASFGDASYLRVKNVALSYHIPLSILKQIHISAIQIFLQGENAWTFANKKRPDPEIDGSLGSIPPLKTFIAGLKVTL